MKRKTLCVICLIIFSLTIYILFNAFAICNYGFKDNKRKSDVAIVLGAATYCDGVSPVYSERINHGIRLYNEGYVDCIILTGGIADGENESDAFRAKEYAVSRGVPENVILIEEKSRITQQNLEYSKIIMDENKMDKCIIVSDPLHMKRAIVMAEDCGMNAVSSPTQTSMYRTWKTKLTFLMREVFFYIGYKFCRIFVF